MRCLQSLFYFAISPKADGAAKQALQGYNGVGACQCINVSDTRMHAGTFCSLANMEGAFNNLQRCCQLGRLQGRAACLGVLHGVAQHGQAGVARHGDRKDAKRLQDAPLHQRVPRRGLLQTIAGSKRESVNKKCMKTGNGGHGQYKLQR